MSYRQCPNCRRELGEYFFRHTREEWPGLCIECIERCDIAAGRWAYPRPAPAPAFVELVAIRNAAEERLIELQHLLRISIGIAELDDRAEPMLGDQIRRVALLARALAAWPEGLLPTVPPA